MNLKDQFSEIIIESANEVMPHVNTNDLTKKADSICKKYGLDFGVEKHPLQFQGENTGIFATRRTDDGSWFGPVGEDYVPFQNHSAVMLALLVARHLDFDIASAGALCEGAWPYVQINTGSIDGIGQNNDTVKQYATVTTSHDLKFALRFGYSDLVISCSNTFRANNRMLGKQNSIRHSEGMSKKLKELLKLSEEVKKTTKKALEIYGKMSEVKLSTKAYNRVVEMLTKVKAEQLLPNASEEVKSMNARTRIKVDLVKECLDHEIGQKGSTLWGLWNGVTYYTTHMYAGDNAKNRDKEKFAGHLHRDENKVFAELAASMS